MTTASSLQRFLKISICSALAYPTKLLPAFLATLPFTSFTGIANSLSAHAIAYCLQIILLYRTNRSRDKIVCRQVGAAHRYLRGLHTSKFGHPDNRLHKKRCTKPHSITNSYKPIQPRHVGVIWQASHLS